MTFKTLKQIIRKYTTSIILAGTLGLTFGCSPQEGSIVFYKQHQPARYKTYDRMFGKSISYDNEDYILIVGKPVSEQDKNSFVYSLYLSKEKYEKYKVGDMVNYEDLKLTEDKDLKISLEGIVDILNSYKDRK